MTGIQRLRALVLVEMQGYPGLDDHGIRTLAPWLKVAPGICASVALMGTLFASPVVLGALRGRRFWEPPSPSTASTCSTSSSSSPPWCR